MTPEIAKNIGIKKAIQSATIGIFYGFAYWFGKNAGYEILINKKDSDKVEAKYGFLTLIITTFLVGWTGSVQAGNEPYDTFWDSFEDYIFKPFFWITFIGVLPAIFVGILFGKWIRKRK